MPESGGDASPSSHETIHSLVEAIAATRGGQTALMCGDTTVSFHALNCRANIVARELLSLGIPALGGLFVGIIAPPGESYVIAVLAILKTGNAFCPIEPEHPARKVKGMCSDAGVQWMVTAHTKAVASVLTGGWFGGVVLQMDSLLVECGCAVPNSLSDVSQCSRNLALAVPDTQAAYVLFTSGSTGGRPLGVCGTHGAALCRFRWSWTTFPWDAATDVACAKTAVSWIDALYEVFGALCQGVPVVVVETSTRKDINAFIKLLRRTRVTRLILTPTLLRVLLPDLLFLPSLKHVTSSGEALPFSLARRFLGSSVTLVNLYGSTEVCGDATCFRMPPMPDPGACDEDDAGTPLGTSITGVCVVIVDPETLAVLPIGEVGELLIYGNTLARGYVGHPEETARRFPILPLGIGGEEVRCFRTGDFGHIDAKGVSHFSGRRDDQVKVKGVRISTHEVELALLEVPGVTAACVVAAGVDPQRLVAFYAPKTMAPTAIITAMQGRLPSSYIPSRAVPLAHLPQLRNGKVDRHKLKQTALRSLKEGTRGPTDPLSDGGGGSTNAIDGFALVVRALSSCSRISSAPTRKCTLADLGLDSLDLMVLKKILEGEVRVFKLLEGRTVNTYLLIAQVPGLSLNIYDDAPLGDVAQRIDATLCDKDLAAVSSTPLVPRGLDMERDQEGRLTRRGGILACATGDFDVARALVMGGWDARISTDRNGSTALMWAAGLGQCDVVRWLLVEQGVPVDAENKRGRTALMEAAKHGELECVQELLAGGADALRTTADGSALMDLAIMGGHIPCIDYVLGLHGTDRHHQNKFRCTAIHWACSAGSLATCRWLFERGFDFTAINDANHGAVNVAAWRGHRDVVEWALLDKDGPLLTAQLAAIDHEGLSLVQLTTMAGHIELAQWLQKLTESPS